MWHKQPHMDQEFPLGWPELPPGIYYEKELSEKFTTETEPEYIIGNEEGIRFVIREYEGGDREIVAYDLIRGPSMKIKENEVFFPILEDLYHLLECDYLHTPPVNEVLYRGYHPDKRTIWELTSDEEITEREPSEFTAPSFLKVNLSQTELEDKGQLLAKVKSTKRENFVDIHADGIELNDETMIRKFYSNLTIHEKDDEIVAAYPTPETVLIENTINKLVDNPEDRIEYIHPKITVNLTATNI